MRQCTYVFMYSCLLTYSYFQVKQNAPFKNMVANFNRGLAVKIVKLNVMQITVHFIAFIA